MNPPFEQIYEELQVSEPKGPEAVWTPIRTIRDEWENVLDMERELADHRARVTNFIEHQKELSAEDTDDTNDTKYVSSQTFQRNMELCRRLEEEQQRQKLIEEEIKKKTLQRHEESEKELTNKLLEFNDLKRHYLYGHNLTNPIPIEHCATATHDYDNSITTLSDLKKLTVRKMPQVSLDKMLEPVSNWSIDMLPEKPDLIEELLHIFRDNIGPTVTVVIDDKKYFCHSILLNLMSDFFNNRDSSNVVHLPASKVPQRCFVNMYRWMLEPINSITMPQLIELLEASKFLGMEELNKQCWRLSHDVLRNKDYVLTMYIASQQVCGTIERVIIPYVGRVWMPFASSQEFLNLEFNKVLQFLKMDSLAVNSEMEVLYCAIRWLDGDWPNRKRYAIDLMQVVRFELLSLVFLIVFNKRKDGPPALSYIRESKTVRNSISEALRFQKKKIGNIQRHLGVRLRSWIYDPACSYHHSRKCNAAPFIAYSDFTDYINWLQKFGAPIGNRIKWSTDHDIVCC